MKRVHWILNYQTMIKHQVPRTTKDTNALVQCMFYELVVEADRHTDETLAWTKEQSKLVEAIGWQEWLEDHPPLDTEGKRRNIINEILAANKRKD
jgi:hypothetical protein